MHWTPLRWLPSPTGGTVGRSGMGKGCTALDPGVDSRRCESDPSVIYEQPKVQTDVDESASWRNSGLEAKRMGSALVSAGLVELALFTMT